MKDNTTDQRGQARQSGRKLFQFQPMSGEAGGAEQWFNLDALEWAYHQPDLGLSAKAVLMTFAIHANDKGEAFVSVEGIADRWNIDRETVRRQITALIKKRKIKDTKERRGATGQVKVYKLSFQSGGKSHPFPKQKSGVSAVQESAKRRTSGGGSAPNIKHITTNKQHIHDSSTCGTSTPTAPSKPSESSSSLFLNFEEAKKRKSWNVFERYCKSKDGTPTLKGYVSWLQTARPAEYQQLVEAREHSQRIAARRQAQQKRLARFNALTNEQLLAIRDDLIGKHKTEHRDSERAELEAEMRGVRDTLKARNVKFPAYHPTRNETR